ncbi:hypothetical protein [Dubosiella newyorkensis]|uniref:hypothetical protein n=1 Tax=Dubosiella newyorkensis TaxID=1862672 RepID=UPI003F676C29
MYFDCTNYYFEIDREDDWSKKKGPSKENRKIPFFGMGLLLDSNCIPIGMRLYPGNQSENLFCVRSSEPSRNRDNITGQDRPRSGQRTELRRQQFTMPALLRDGYLFSKSVKMLSGKEKDLGAPGYRDGQKSRDEKGKLV